MSMLSIAACMVAGLTLTACSSSSSSPAAPRAHVLLVGTYHGKKGQYTTIGAAVAAAKSGDWILVAPGDYHETADQPKAPAEAVHGELGGVLITTPDLHLRGMDRNTVFVDGTKDTGTTPCSSEPSAQNFGPVGTGGKADGRNGIVAWKADGVNISNLTVCNFLGGADPSGNEIWWNGGAGSGKIGLTGYQGSYLTATSTYFGGEDTAAQYGIFASNAAGPASLDQLYASNFNDSGTYVGACLQACDVTIDHAWMEYSALGYSGTNSGGSIVIENSQFDNNKDGFDTNSEIAGDPPAPQNGACPGNKTSPITHTHSCWVFFHNNVHDNNNPNTPIAGNAAAGPVGTGMTVSGGRNDTVMDNTFSNNGAWGTLFVPYPDQGTPSLNQSCSKTGGVEQKGLGCVYDPMNDSLVGNTYTHNGYFGNPSNSDFGQITLFGNEPQNCYRGNVAPDGSAPADLDAAQSVCGTPTKAGNTGGTLFAQVLCDTGFGGCPAGAAYPKATGVVMHPLPKNLPTMPKPCAGVPANPWCPSGSGSAGSAVKAASGGRDAVAAGALRGRVNGRAA